MTLALLQALKITGELPDVQWLQGDDLCDCTFQRIGEWTNPYIAQTLRIRMCCLFAELQKEYPQCFQEISAYYDVNRHKWQTTPVKWDSIEYDMPMPLWYRMLSFVKGKPLATIRKEYAHRKGERSKKISKAEQSALKKDPTLAELEHAQNARLELAGWL